MAVIDKNKLAQAAAALQQNGLSAGAHVWLPNLDMLNLLRAEEGHAPLTRDQVPDNIHFASEIPDEDL